MLLFRRRYRAEFGTIAGWRFDPALFARLMRFGLPNGIAAALDTLGLALFTLFIGRMGDAELDATSVAFALNMVTFLPLIGIGQAVEILVGRRLGENDSGDGRALHLGRRRLRPAHRRRRRGGLRLLPRADGRAVPRRRPAVGPGAGDGAAACCASSRCIASSTRWVWSSPAPRGAGDTRFVTITALATSWLVLVLPTWAVWTFGWGLLWAWTFVSAYVILLALVFSGVSAGAPGAPCASSSRTWPPKNEGSMKICKCERIACMIGDGRCYNLDDPPTGESSSSA